MKNAINPQSKDFEDKITEGIQKAVRKLIEKKKKENDCLVVMRNGQVRRIPAKDLH